MVKITVENTPFWTLKTLSTAAAARQGRCCGFSVCCALFWSMCCVAGVSQDWKIVQIADKRTHTRHTQTVMWCPFCVLCSIVTQEVTNPPVTCHFKKLSLLGGLAAR